ncbi:sel1 repeat family protein, partial [Acinetobacter baumannii]
MKLSIKILLSFSLCLFISPVFADQKSFQETEIRATQGNAKAQYNLGLMYDKGQGVTQSYAKAAEWYSKAADQGLADAQFNLGQMYRKGQGVAQSYAKAAEWYS